MSLSPKDINFFIRQANKKTHLSDWDQQFIEDMENRVEKDNYSLTQKQEEQLHRIAME